MAPVLSVASQIYCAIVGPNWGIACKARNFDKGGGGGTRMGIMQSLFGGGSQSLVGLDISSSSVKLLELSQRGERYHVEAYAAEPLPANAVTDKQVVEVEAVGEAIARAVARAGTRTKHACAAVSGSSAITKIIAMPDNLRDQDLEEQIKVEADQYIPYPIEEVNLDFEILGVSDKSPDSVDVLLAACRSEQVDNLSTALELAGLTPKCIDIETFAMENACQLLRHQMPDGGAEKTIAVVDMGATVTAVMVLHDLESVYTRDQSFGGKQLTEEIMRHFGMSAEEAGKAKRYGNLPETYESEILPAFIDDMAQQIDRSLQFFFSASSQYANIDQIILAGGCAHIPNVDSILQEKLQIATTVARPFAEMTVATKAKPKQLAQDEGALLVACGLALRAFDARR